MLLRITNGATTVILNDDDGTPAVGLSGVRYIPAEGEGATVTETIDVVFNGVSDAIIDALTAVRAMLAEATETPVYIEYAAIDAFTPWRSKIESGRLVWSSDKSLRQFNPTYTVGEMAIVITRQDFWEGPSTILADGANIRNGFASPYNGVTLGNMAGDQPTPLKVEVQTSASVSPNFVYLNIDSFAGLTSNQHILTTGGGAKSWTSATHNNLTWIMPIPEVTIAKLAGRDVNVMAGFSALPNGVYLRATLYSQIGGLYLPIDNGGEKYTADRKLHNLGTVHFPKLINGNLVLILTIYMPTAGSANLAFAQLTPAAHGLRLGIAGNWLSGDIVTHDGAEKAAYYDNGFAFYPTVTPEGGPLMAWPNRTNRLYALFDEVGSMNTTRQMLITVTARPRRKTL